jgi:hypothetical protein
MSPTFGSQPSRPMVLPPTLRDIAVLRVLISPSSPEHLFDRRIAAGGGSMSFLLGLPKVPRLMEKSYWMPRCGV